MKNTRPIKPYRERSTPDLLYITAILHQRELPIPTDLAAALADRGIDAENI